jgi:hypothetical protein
MEALPTLGAAPPQPVDLAARDVAAQALVAKGPEDVSLEALVAIEAAREDAGEPPTGILPHALEARDATLDGHRARRRASQQLLRRRDLDPAMRARLELEVEDDPLRLADARIHDSRVQKFGRRVNALVEPIGRSLSNLAMLPFRAASAVVGLIVKEISAPELSTPERQALDHWKHFIERNPGTPEAAELLDRVDRSQRRWYETRRDEEVAGARRALRQGDAALALARAERALHYAPEDRTASRLLAEAEAKVQRERAERARALEAAPVAEDLAGGRPLAVALLLSDGDVAGEAERLRVADPRGPLADEAAFARALAEAEAGAEDRAWRHLDDVADASDERSNMARHAYNLVHDPHSHPYGAWRRSRRAQVGDVARFLFLGPLANGPRSRNLPRPLEWLIELPSLPRVAMGLPGRLIRLPFARSKRRSPGVFARRYLERHPEGEHSAEVRRWLQKFETKRGNPLGALRLAQEQPNPDPNELAELREKSAEQMLAAAERQRRLDRQIGMLRQVASQYPETQAGHEAGEAVREVLSTATYQQIRISRGFLTENPAVAGPAGLALRPELLDDDPANGELHPEGVTFIGGSEIEFAFIAASGRKSDEPERLRRQVSDERLARLVALLDETAQRNSLLDQDMNIAPDADRDLFFEGARLGVAETTKQRVTARSTYTYQGVRERYGLVRGRESILPVDLVLQGSLQDMGLGAFPRVRMPKQTPNAFLYR